MNLHKAYGIVEWGALKTIMREMSLPLRYIDWVMKYVTEGE